MSNCNALDQRSQRNQREGMCRVQQCHAGGLQHGHWVRRFPRDRQRCAGPDGRAQTEQDFREAPRLVARAHHGRDFTLRGLIDELADRGLKVDYRSVREFVHAENLSLKKALSPANAAVLTPPAGARNGRNIRVTSIPSVCSLSTRPGPRPTWQPCVNADSKVPKCAEVKFPSCRGVISR